MTLIPINDKPLIKWHEYQSMILFKHIMLVACADTINFVRGGPNFIRVFFLINEGIDDPNITINGPS